jgi:hypothetical protein
MQSKIEILDFNGLEVGIIPFSGILENASSDYLPTSSKIDRKIFSLKETVTSICNSFSKEFEEGIKGTELSCIEIELSLSLEAESKLWIIGAKGTGSISVKFTWKG